MKTNREFKVSMDNEKFSDQLDVLKETISIKSSIREDITSDFVLASNLSEQDKTGIIEMTGDAYFSKKIIKLYAERGFNYEWDKNKKDWAKNEDGSYKKVGLNNDEKQKIYNIAERLFTAYMIKIMMTVILNRNVDKNYLISLLTNRDNEKTSEEAEEREEEKKMGFIKRLLKREKKE